MTALALSSEQRAATTDPSDHLMILAPPGCGKTDVLAHRTAHLIPLLLPDQRILALTFTNRAQANLSARLREVLGVARMRRFVTVRNFHGHATEIILAHGRSVGLQPSHLRRPKTSTLSKALSATGADITLRLAAEALLGSIKRAPLTDAEVLAEIDDRVADPARSVALRVERERQDGNQLHYDDLLRHAQRILRVEAVAHLYQCHYGAILVDEFQDMSMQHLDLVRRSCSARRTYAGDPSQGIFTWAGATPEQVEADLRSECGEPLRLRESYRSSPRVLTLVNRVSTDMGLVGDLRAAQPDRWPEEGCSARIAFPDQEAEATGLVEIATAVLASHPEASVGVISRAAWRRDKIDAEFRSTTLPVRRWDLPWMTSRF